MDGHRCYTSYRICVVLAHTVKDIHICYVTIQKRKIIELHQRNPSVATVSHPDISEIHRGIVRYDHPLGYAVCLVKQHIGQKQ